MYHIFLVCRWAGPEPSLRKAEHVELRWFTPSKARGLDLADSQHLELFAKVEALQCGRRRVVAGAAAPDLHTPAWLGSTLLVLRAGASLVQLTYLAATGRFRVTAVGIWEPWFDLGAFLFSLSTWLSRPGGLLESVARYRR